MVDNYDDVVKIKWRHISLQPLKNCSYECCPYFGILDLVIYVEKLLHV